MFQGRTRVTSVSTTRGEAIARRAGVGVGSSEASVKARVAGVKCETTTAACGPATPARSSPGGRVTDFHLAAGKVSSVTVGLVIDLGPRQLGRQNGPAQADVVQDPLGLGRACAAAISGDRRSPYQRRASSCRRVEPGRTGAPSRPHLRRPEEPHRRSGEADVVPPVRGPAPSTLKTARRRTSPPSTPRSGPPARHSPRPASQRRDDPQAVPRAVAPQVRPPASTRVPSCAPRRMRHQDRGPPRRERRRAGRPATAASPPCSPGEPRWRRTNSRIAAVAGSSREHRARTRRDCRS